MICSGISNGPLLYPNLFGPWIHRCNRSRHVALLKGIIIRGILTDTNFIRGRKIFFEAISQYIILPLSHRRSRRWFIIQGIPNFTTIPLSSLSSIGCLVNPRSISKFLVSPSNRAVFKLPPGATSPAITVAPCLGVATFSSWTKGEKRI